MDMSPEELLELIENESQEHEMNPEDREDLVQEVYLSFHMNPISSDVKGIKSYVKKTVKNKFSDFLNREGRREEVFEDFCSRLSTDERLSLESNENSVDLIIDVAEVVSKLPYHLRQIAELLPFHNKEDLQEKLDLTKYQLSNYTNDIKYEFIRFGLGDYFESFEEGGVV